MEKLFKILSLQNKYFKPDDPLTDLITETLASVEDEIGEEDLQFVQAARGSSAFMYPDNGKETERK